MLAMISLMEKLNVSEEKYGGKAWSVERSEHSIQFFFLTPNKVLNFHSYFISSILVKERLEL